MIRFLRTGLPLGIFALFVAGFLSWVLPAGAAEQTLASEALAAAVERGTVKEVGQEMTMDLHQRKKYEFDEEGVEALGKKLLNQGDQETAIEILQLNQVFHGQSVRAANALADAYRQSGNPTVARLYYDTALKLDSENAHARQASQGLEGKAADAEPPKNLEEAMARLSEQMSPEAARQVQAMMQQVQEQGAEEQHRRESMAQAKPETKGEEDLLRERQAQRCADLGAKYESFGGPTALARLTGQYGAEDDTQRLKTWNIEPTCDGKALHAIPLWADVAPGGLTPVTRVRFSDTWDGTWEFQLDASGRAESASHTGSDGQTQRLIRLGEPYSFD